MPIAAATVISTGQSSLIILILCCTNKPEDPNPKRATDTATNAKWYQIAAENIRVIAISMTRPESEVRNIPANSSLRLDKVGKSPGVSIFIFDKPSKNKNLHQFLL